MQIVLSGLVETVTRVISDKCKLGKVMYCHPGFPVINREDIKAQKSVKTRAIPATTGNLKEKRYGL
jgi:hypothetical protein